MIKMIPYQSIQTFVTILNYHPSALVYAFGEMTNFLCLPAISFVKKKKIAKSVLEAWCSIKYPDFLVIKHYNSDFKNKDS